LRLDSGGVVGLGVRLALLYLALEKVEDVPAAPSDSAVKLGQVRPVRPLKLLQCHLLSLNIIDDEAWKPAW
jgi:hypothetical protein